MSDPDLLDQFIAKASPEAFAQIVDRHAAMVYATCLRILGDPHAAEDATQATFLVLMKKAPGLSRNTVLGVWLFRAATFVARNARKGLTLRRRHERDSALMKTEDN